MVGHTGSMEAAIIAMETVDKCLGNCWPRSGKQEALLLSRRITAMRIRCSQSIKKKGVKSVKTAHSLNPVPFIIYDPLYQGEYRMADIKEKGLSNIAADSF